MSSKQRIDQLRRLSPEQIRRLAEAARRNKAESSGPALQRHHGRSEYPLSFEQERLWFLDQLFPGSVAYNWPSVMEVESKIEPQMWQAAIELLVRRHEILRTVYEVRDGVPFQKVADESRVSLQVDDLQTVRGVAEREKAVRLLVSSELNKPFDLSRGPLFRCGLIRLESDISVVWFVFHHTISDGWSSHVIANELSALMRQIATDGGRPLPPLPIQYGDYAVWQRACFTGEAAAKLRSYWTTTLRELPALDFPTDFRRPTTSIESGATEWFGLPGDLAVKLDGFAKSQGSSFFTVMLAAFQCLLMRYARSLDIGVAVPVSCRTRSDLEHLIGFFVNTIIIRGDLSGDPTFVELVHRTKDVCNEAFSHQEMPFGELIRELNPARELNRNPLTQILFQVEASLPANPATHRDGAPARSIDVDLRSVFFDIEVHIHASGSAGARQVRGMITYSRTLFKEETIKRLALHYRRFLESVMEDPTQKISSVPMLSEAEAGQLLAWGRTGGGLDQQTAAKLFGGQAAENRAGTNGRVGAANASESGSDEGNTAAGAAPPGRPLENQVLYVLDVKMNLVPVGVVGELCVGVSGAGGGDFQGGTGEGRLLPDPFREEAGGRLYRTGELARWLSSGRLELIGPADDLVKFRGHSIALKEIESAMLKLSGVRDAAVVVQAADGGDESVVGYIVPSEGRALNPIQIQEALAQQLPPHMIPSYWVLLDDLPRSLNGKADRRALPPPEPNSTGKSHKRPPRDELERGLGEMWKSLLGVNSVGLDENFFDLGGHSLLASKLVLRIREAYSVSLPVAVLFQHGTIQSLASLLRGEGVGVGKPSTLVRLRPGQEGAPLFLIHPAGGDVFCYLELARRVRGERPVYGLQDVDDAVSEGADAIEAMAARYLREVRRIQGAGPYRMAGWSMGGLLAYEMARQLEQANEDVAFLGVLDYAVTDAQPESSAAGVSDAASLAIIGNRLAAYAGVRIALSAEDFERSASPEERFQVFGERMRELGLLPPEVGNEFWPRFLRVYHRNVTSVSQYRPGTYGGKLSIFRSNEDVADSELERAARRDRYLGWRQFCTGPVSVHEVPGNHMTMMTKPHVDVLAREMSDVLDGITSD